MKTIRINSETIPINQFMIINLIMMLLGISEAYCQNFPLDPPSVDWRRSDWATVRPNDGVTLNRHTAGEDWWYGHCNAYNGNEFVGYMCVGFGRPILNYPSTNECFNPSQNIPSEYSECDGQAYHAIGLIDKSGNNAIMHKLIKNSYEELFNVIQTSDGNFVAVGFNPGIKDVNDNYLIYNPSFDGDNLTFNGSNTDCLPNVDSYHSYVIKFDISGNVIWQYLYGKYDPINQSVEELRKARFSPSIAYDLVEINSNRIRIVGTELKEYNNNPPTYQDPNFYSQGFILDIDANGFVLDRHEVVDNIRYGENLIPAKGTYLYGIDKLPSTNGSDIFVISGNAKYLFQNTIGGDNDGCNIDPIFVYGADLYQSNLSFADVFSYDGTDYNEVWQNAFKFRGDPTERRLSSSFDVKTLSDGRICMSSLVYTSGCISAGENRAKGFLHILNASTGAIESFVEVPDLLAAFDLKIGITALSDGGFAMVSSTQTTPPFQESELAITSTCYSEGRGYRLPMTNTDAYVARFDNQCNLLWKKSFNVTDTNPVVSTIDDPKQQECMYSISVCPTDQSFVIAGNNSFNMDDCYLVKLKSDCSYFEQFDINRSESDPYSIANNEIWSSSKKIRGPVIIPSDGTLTIEGVNTIIEFADYHDRENDGTRLEIQPGGKLIINDARLTSLINCPGSTWRGVIVRGDANENQYSTVNGVSHQGKFIGNNCTIENAEEAIEVVNSNGWQSGGIVQARNCLFKNNERCVSFQSYRNLTPAGNETSNFSYFEKCHFLIDQPLIKGNDPRGIVTLWAVKGIQFRGCKWENTNPQATTAASLGFNGIFGIDADFSVGSYCDQLLQVNQPCDPAYYTRSEFINMNAGIRSQKTSGLTRFTVGETDFKNCVYGVYNEGHDYIVASNNKFTQGNNILSPFFDIGILNITGTKYSIEQNVFSSPSQSLTEFSIGTTIFNSGMLTNEVYKNDFSSLSIANLALGNNRNNNPTSNQQFSGLEYRCNLMSNNDFDIAVIGFDKFGGINMYQGGIASGNKIDAGNTFSQNGNPETDIYNWSDNPILYVYNPTIAEQEPIYRTQSVSNIAFQGPYNLCLPKRGGKVTKMVKLTTAEHISLSNSATASLAELSTLKNYYSSLLDGGSTDARLTEVASAVSTEAEALRTQLISKSPYLSTDVLQKAAEKSDVLPNQLLFEILLANPDGIRGEELKRYLAEKDNPFPEEWLEYLADQNGIITYRTTLEFLLNTTQKELESACDQLISDALVSDNGYDLQTIRYTASINPPSLHNDFLLFDEMIEEGDYNAADSLLDLMPYQYRLTPEQLIEYNDFRTLSNIVIDVRSQDQSSKNITEAQKSELVELANSGTLIPNIRAKNWLSLLTGKIDWFVPTLPVTTQAKKSKVAKKTPSFLPQITLSPNPAKNVTYLTFDRVVDNNLHLDIIDAFGRTTKSLQLSNSPLQAIDISTLSSGLYVMRITDAKGVVQTKKLIVQ
jgi:hypothetical protein